jgi:hypothetical protein
VERVRFLGGTQKGDVGYLKGTGPERDGFYRFYSSRIQVLPTVGRHHPPDGGHAVLDGLVLLAFFSAMIAVFKHSPQKSLN